MRRENDDSLSFENTVNMREAASPRLLRKYIVNTVERENHNVERIIRKKRQVRRIRDSEFQARKLRLASLDHRRRVIDADVARCPLRRRRLRAGDGQGL